MDKTARQQRIYMKVRRHLRNIDDLVAVLGHRIGGPHRERSYITQLGDDVIHQRKAQEVTFGIMGETLERQNRQTSKFLGGGLRRRLPAMCQIADHSEEN